MFEVNVLRAWLETGRLSARQTFRAALVAGIAIAGASIGLSQPAQALPSFARQTGQPCGTCHTDYPGLTPYGRLFKMNGYTAGGGKFKTTLFSTGGDPTKALANYADKKDAQTNNAYMTQKDAVDTSKVWVPPIAMMAVFGYTHTQAAQDNDPYNPNDNWTIPQISLFWGGAFTQHVGAFSQWTYDGRSAWGWDNQDWRYANTAMLGNMNVIYGVSADNNPTVGDPWNTVPAWTFPYMTSNVAPDPGVGTIVDGAYAQEAVGAGAYAFVNNLVYLQVSGYRSLSPDTLGRLGADPYGAPYIDGIAPYWRVAVEPHWGRNWLEFGTFGMYARVHPWTNDNNQSPLADRYTDIAFDTQYQYQGDNYWLTLRGTYIHESQALDASFNDPNVATPADNPTNSLNTIRLYGSVAYGDNNRVVVTAQYFDTWGTADASFFAGDTNGYVAEISYFPFMNNHAPVWPWANVRVGAQYTYYNKFDGTTDGAQDNNTLFLYAWVAM